MNWLKGNNEQPQANETDSKLTHDRFSSMSYLSY